MSTLTIPGRGWIEGGAGEGIKGDFAPQLRDPACAGKFGMRNSKIGEWPYYAPNPLRRGAAKGLGIKGLRKRVEGSRREGAGERWKRGLKGEAEGLD